jgi:tRNA(Ile)-lysidine synthase
MTAHHGNDQVETVLMNLSRQSGIPGLCGIGKRNGHILRPFLGFTKRDLSLFVERTQIPYREDSTNSNLSIPRNFIRHAIIKPWEKNVKNLVNSIKGSVDHISEWKDALDFFIVEMILPKVKQSDNEFHIPLNLIETMPILVKIRLVQILLDRTNHQMWSKHQIKILKSFFHKEEIGNEHILPNGWKLLRDRTSIIGKNMRETTKNVRMELLPNIPVEFNHYRYELLFDNQSELESNQNQEWVDWSLLKNQKLEIRSWTDGDSFQPLGMDGHQKISDFLINEKVDRFSKESQVVMTANNEIIWVCGRRLADWVKLTKNTKETATLNRRQIII